MSLARDARSRDRASDATPAGVWRDAAIAAAVGLIVRLVYFFVNSRTNPAFDYLIMDAMHIDQWARAIAAGDAGGAAYFRGPLYPYLLALVYKVTGGSLAAGILLNHVAGAATCGLVVLLARRWFTRGVALAAGLVTALYWPLVYFEGEILVESVFITLLVLSLWRLAVAAARPTLLRLIVAGACLGLAVLARPTALILLLVVPLAFRCAPSVRAAMPWWRSSLMAAGVCLLMLVPATIHNLRASGGLVPVAWSGGLNFYIGNNPESDGRSAVIPGTAATWMGGGDEALAIARQQAGRDLTAAQASSYFTARGFDFVTQRPGAAATLFLSKLYMVWEGPERSNEKYVYFFWNRYGLGKAPLPGFWLVGPFALTGLVLLWPRRRELALLYAAVGAYMLALALFFVVARFRLPLAPVLIVFATCAVFDLAGAIRARAVGRIVGVSVLLAVAFLATNAGYPRFLNQRASHDIISYYALAGAMVEKNDSDGALRELARARAAFERAPSPRYLGIAQDIYFKLGTLLYQRGRWDDAATALGRVLPGDPRAGAARIMFAECCENAGRFEEGRRAWTLVLRADPGNRRAREGLIRCLEGLGRYDEAARERANLPPR
jgi:4-amino-4-deoxy-L-arabinose transferase-like glycosyltransferase